MCRGVERKSFRQTWTSQIPRLVPPSCVATRVSHGLVPRDGEKSPLPDPDFLDSPRDLHEKRDGEKSPLLDTELLDSPAGATCICRNPCEDGLVRLLSHTHKNTRLAERDEM